MPTHRECSARVNYYYNYLPPGQDKCFSDEVKALPKNEQYKFARLGKVQNFVFCDQDREHKKKLAFIHQSNILVLLLSLFYR